MDLKKTSAAVAVEILTVRGSVGCRASKCLVSEVTTLLCVLDQDVFDVNCLHRRYYNLSGIFEMVFMNGHSWISHTPQENTIIIDLL